MPLREFEPGRPYRWEDILSTLAAPPYDYKAIKRGALAVPEDPSLPVFVFPTEGHAKYEDNRHDRARRTVYYHVNLGDTPMNERLRASTTGVEVGLFYRVGSGDFTFLGPARCTGETDDIFHLQY